ncbi:MAG: oligoribonuclease [Pseudomonadota bacterium]
MQDQRNLIWIDLEMTGLEPATDRIIEIATIITDQYLNTIAVGPMLAIHQDQSLMSNMGEWCTKQHGLSGLTKRVANSTITSAAAEQQTLEFIRKYVPAGVSPLCGNSIAQDRRFLVNEMPTLEVFFHYRNYDVSAVKEMLKRWSPKSFAGDYNGVPVFEKNSQHLALSDIEDSIAELKHYRKYFFKDLD